jgi:hypothetical protein
MLSGAMDVHAAGIVVIRKLRGAKLQPPQTFKPADFLAWVQKQQSHSEEIIIAWVGGAAEPR